MYTSWTKHLPKDKHTEFAMQVSAALPVLKRLSDLLKEDLATSEKLQKEKNYQDAAWAFSQADSIGEQRAYNRALRLINNLIK